MNTTAMVQTLKEEEQDHEWYPTTKEMIWTVWKEAHKHFDSGFSVLDIGAGDGRVLIDMDCVHSEVRLKDMFAIEISPKLIQAMPKNICIVGTDFLNQTLIDKKVDIIFCNPPYSQYEEWTRRILREGNCRYVYMIIPDRWINHAGIQDAIEKRKAKVKILDTTNFASADRKARCTVDIVQFDLLSDSGHYTNADRVDPFKVWFDEYFTIDARENEYESEMDKADRTRSRMEKRVDNALVKGKSQVEALVELYRTDMDKLLANYQTVAGLDADILRELDISIEGIMKALREKIKGLKHLYWQELFSRLDTMTKRLTTKVRENMIRTLNERTDVDFTEQNISAIVIWALKHVNDYFDDQLLDLFYRMCSKDNITGYKSNSHLTDDDWRYCRDRSEIQSHHFQLEYRIVLHNYYAIKTKDAFGDWDWPNGLHTDAHNYISDIFTVANNLGFEVKGSTRNVPWASNLQQEFYCKSADKDHELFCTVRAFMNGNIHVKLNQRFMRAFNIEAGRLLGWLRSPKEAANQMGLSVDFASRFFGSNLKLKSVPLLTA